MKSNWLRIALSLCVLYPVSVCIGDTSSPPPVSPSPEVFKPLVLLNSLEQGIDNSFSFKTRRVGFVVGDGSLIVTAEHCIDDFRTMPAPSSSRSLFAISPYYGDIFPVEIVAYDDVADVAVLKATWPSHPAFALAEPGDLQPGDSSLIPSIPPIRDTEQHINTHFLLEQLTVERIDHKALDKAILFTRDGLIQRGWSGSPILLQDSQSVTGVMCQLRQHTVSRAVFFKKKILKAAGCHVQSLLKLLRAHDLDQAALGVPPTDLPDIPDGVTVFGHVQDTFSALFADDVSEAMTHIQQAIDARPNSAYLHFLLGHVASAQKDETEQEGKRLLQLKEDSMARALALAPEDPHILAVYANHLNKGSKRELAQEYSLASLDHDPNNSLALYVQLLLKHENDPQQAAIYGQRLTDAEPNNTMAWFYTSKALLSRNQPEEALHAAQQAVVTDPNGLIRGALAEAFVVLDRLEEAQTAYEYMAHKCQCENCWFQYARFLIHHLPAQADAAQQALDTARSCAKKRGIPPRALDQLQIQIQKRTDPNQAQAQLESWLEQDPNDGDTWWRLADILRVKGQYEEAAHAAQKAVTLDPNNIYTPRLADCLAKAGQAESARAVYDSMVQAHPERPRYWYYYAKYLQETNRPRLARAAFDRIGSGSDRKWRVSQKDRDELLEKIIESEQASDG